jgi:RNA polymerase sigma-70 factor (ECF subfamily)
MHNQQALAERFEADRVHLRAVAYRLLGSLHDADDAVQTAWLKVSEHGISGVDNPTGWFTTVTAHECLDRLRQRKRRAEVLGADGLIPAAAAAAPAADEEVATAESVGRALMVVLDRLSPAQRVAFILHDVFAVPFDVIGEVVDRSPAAAKKLASRARQRVYAAPTVPEHATAEHLEIAEAFIAASRHGNLAMLMEILAPDVVRHVDRVLVPKHVSTELRGAKEFAEETRMFATMARSAEVALLDGTPGIVVAPAGRLKALLRLDIRDGRVHAIDIIGATHRLTSVAVSLPVQTESVALSMGGRREDARRQSR